MGSMATWTLTHSFSNASNGQILYGVTSRYGRPILAPQTNIVLQKNKKTIEGWLGWAGELQSCQEERLME